MTHRYPSYYDKFRCIADLCPDSCCKDWDVVVDSGTEAFYNTVQGELGDKLRRLTVTDEDGDRVFVLQNGKCPFWNSDMLCDIYTELGEEHLCRTCQNFPRITADYTVFAEHMLSFACPEAARLILAEDNAYAELNETPDSLACEDYDAELMRVLLAARKKSADILQDRSLPFAQRLIECLRLNSELSDDLNGADTPVITDNEAPRDIGFIFDFFDTLDYMHADNKRLILRGRDIDNSIDLTPYDGLFERLGLYYLYRYYLNAINDSDVLGCIRRMICAYLVIGHSLCAEPKPDPLLLTQRYSKEIEHSYENNEELDFAFAADTRFSAQSLISVLESIT